MTIAKKSVSRFNPSNLFNKFKSLQTKYIIIILIIIIGTILGIVFLTLYLVKKSDKSDNSSMLTSTRSNTTPFRGYYNLTWSSKGSGNPTGDWNIGILFGGENPTAAITNNLTSSNKISAPIKYLNLGGGVPPNGWDMDSIAFVNNNLRNIKNNNWNGICFDIEICPPNIDFISAFQTCFSNCKQIGLQVFVTMSGIVPWSCNAGRGQGDSLVNSWINDVNIDYISPQLYAQGDTLITADLTKFANAKAKIMPSIPYDTDWPSIQNLGIIPYGYIVWNHDSNVPPPPPPPPPHPVNNNICGTDWAGAQNNCVNNTIKTCNINDDCPTEQKCYNFPCYSDKKCGISWIDATNNCGERDNCPNGLDSECLNGQRCYDVDKKCS